MSVSGVLVADSVLRLSSDAGEPFVSLENMASDACIERLTEL